MGIVRPADHVAKLGEEAEVSYNTLAIDSPGQGNAFHIQKIPSRRDYYVPARLPWTTWPSR